jgi:hypothetical protein
VCLAGCSQKRFGYDAGLNCITFGALNIEMNNLINRPDLSIAPRMDWSGGIGIRV